MFKKLQASRLYHIGKIIAGKMPALHNSVGGLKTALLKGDLHHRSIFCEFRRLGHGLAVACD